MGAHRIYRVTAVAVVGPHTLDVTFDDGLTRRIDLEPVLAGELYGTLCDPVLFAQVRVNPEVYEVYTVVWPNGADFAPATLHDWPAREAAFRALARSWAPVHA